MLPSMQKAHEITFRKNRFDSTLKQLIPDFIIPPQKYNEESQMNAQFQNDTFSDLEISNRSIYTPHATNKTQPKERAQNDSITQIFQNKPISGKKLVEGNNSNQKIKQSILGIDFAGKQTINNITNFQNINAKSIQLNLNINNNSSSNSIIIGKEDQTPNSKIDFGQVSQLYSNLHSFKKQSRYFAITEFDQKNKQKSEQKVQEVSILQCDSKEIQKSIFQLLSQQTKKVVAIAQSFVFYQKLKKLAGIRTKQICSSNSVKKKEQKRLIDCYMNEQDRKMKKSSNGDQKNSQLIHKNYNFSSIIDSVPVIHPSSGKLVFWDITNFMFIILNLTYIPIESVILTSFVNIYGQKWYYFLLASISVFIIQILLQTNLGYYDKGQCIMNRKQILQRYFKLGFWLDIMSTVPLILTVIGKNKISNFLNLIIILKVSQVDKFFHKYFEIFTLRRRLYYTAFLKFSYLVLKIFFFGHSFACIFLALAFHVNLEKNWILKYGQGLPEYGWFSKYVYAFYWGITTMTTVGLGDLVPANLYEAVILSLFMFVACGAFAYMFNSIGVVLGELNQRHDLFTEEMRLVSRYLSMKNVNHALSLEVRKYMEYKFEFENEVSIEEEKQVFSKLSQQIKDKLIVSTNIHLLNKCGFLSEHFSEEFLLKLCLSMKMEQKINEEQIFSQKDKQIGNLDDIKFFIIESGQVKLFVNGSQHHQTTLSTISQGKFFGEIEFFTDQPRQYSASAVGATKLLSIKRKNFLSILSEFPQDMEQYYMMRDKVKNNDDQSILKIPCSACSSVDHWVRFCPNLHFIADKELSILRNVFSRTQDRQKNANRGNRQKIKSLYEMPVIQERAREFYSGDKDQSFVEDTQILIPLDSQSPQKSISRKKIVSQVFFPEINVREESPSVNKLIKFNHQPSLAEQIGKKQQRSSSRLMTKKPTLKCENQIDFWQNNRDDPDNTKNLSLNSNNHQIQVCFNDEKKPQNSLEYMIPEFEKGFIYKVYLSHNNYNTVLQQYEEVKQMLSKLLAEQITQYQLFNRKFKKKHDQSAKTENSQFLKSKLESLNASKDIKSKFSKKI